MKWDVKHDRAKEVIDYFLNKAENWQESEDLVAGLTGEEKEAGKCGSRADDCIY